MSALEIVEREAAGAQDEKQDALLSTGIDGLDRILDGGLVRGNSVLIEGPPGSGKSTLGVRIIHEGIVRHREPALIIAFEEFPRQIYREALSAGVDLRVHEEAGLLRVLWTPPSRILEGFNGRDDLVDRIVRDLGVKRLLIDSITHFKRVAQSELELREILATVLCNMKLRGVSSFLVKEIESSEETTIAFEEYLVDASVRIHHDPSVGGAAEGSRSIEVRKTRGQDHVSGKHPIELGRHGFAVYPRVRPDDVARVIGPCDPPPRRRVGTGSSGLDDILSGGFFSGTLNLVGGGSGSGKTALALQFLAARGAGEAGLLVSLKDHPAELAERAAAAGVESEGLRVLSFDPIACSLERIQAAILEEVATRHPERIAFDGLDDLLHAGSGTVALRNHVRVLSRLAAVTGATVLATEEPLDGGQASEHARLAGSVVSLTSQVEDRRLRRRLLVPKHAGSAHDTGVHEYGLSALGLHLLGGDNGV